MGNRPKCMLKSILIAATLFVLAGFSFQITAQEPTEIQTTEILEQEQPAQMARITMIVENIESDIGSLYVSVFDSKKTFLSDDVVFKTTVEVAPALEDGKITIEIDLPYGEYAISIHHDDNDNQKMDSNFMGIPKEPVALSNGHVPKFGPPRYRKAKFSIQEETLTQNFKLN